MNSIEDDGFSGLISANLLQRLERRKPRIKRDFFDRESVKSGNLLNPMK